MANAEQAIDRLEVAYFFHPSQYTLNTLGQMYGISNHWYPAHLTGSFLQEGRIL